MNLFTGNVSIKNSFKVVDHHLGNCGKSGKRYENDILNAHISASESSALGKQM